MILLVCATQSVYMFVCMPQQVAGLFLNQNRHKYIHMHTYTNEYTHMLCFRVFYVVVTPCVHIYFYTIHIEVCICML